MTKLAEVPYIHTRNGHIWFRRRVPERHRACIGLQEWKRSLGRSSLSNPRIRLEARVLTDATDEALAQLERGLEVSRSCLEDALNALYPSRCQTRVQTWEEVAALYIHHRGLKDLRKPEATALDQLCAFHSGKRPFDLKRADVRDWINWLQTQRGQSTATVRRRLTSLKAMFNVVLEVTEATSVNPFESITLTTDVSGTDREPFQAEHLIAIENWLASRTRHGPTETILTLLRATGARPLEIGGLDVGDLSDVDGQIVLRIRPNAHRSLKTRSSTRFLPLPRSAGETLRRYIGGRTCGPVFPSSCHETGSLSARLNKALRAAGVPKSRAFTAYSFRHTFEDALRLGDSPFEVQQALLGHAPKSMTDRYGSKRVSMARLTDASDKADAIITAWSKPS